MSFISPAVLLLLIFVPLLAAFWLWRERHRQAALRGIGDDSLIRDLIPQGIQRRRIGKSVLWLVTIVTLIVALARPVWGIDVDIVASQGVSIMFVLDVSKSMDAQDILPSRLERAKLTLQEMFTGLEGNELGLILFAGSAVIQFPLTIDTFSASSFLKSAGTASISHQGTNLDAALRLALDSFAKANAAKPIIVLLTDGESHQRNTLPSVDEAAEKEIPIYTIGYGDTQGATIPIYDNDGNITGYKSDQFGNLVLSSLDEVTLQNIAQRTGGIYQHASPDGKEAQRVMDAINQIETATLGRTVQTRSVDRFEIFVALAILALSLEILLPETRKNAV